MTKLVAESAKLKPRELLVQISCTGGEEALEMLLGDKVFDEVNQEILGIKLAEYNKLVIHDEHPDVLLNISRPHNCKKSDRLNVKLVASIFFGSEEIMLLKENEGGGTLTEMLEKCFSRFTKLMYEKYC